MKLSELRPGETGVVTKVTGTGAIHRRLLAMGILPGTVIRVARLSPFGDPIEYEIRGVFISLRRSEAEYVEIDRIVPLHLIPAGEKVRIVILDGGMNFIRNMGSIGISPGKIIEIISPCCPMRVRTELGEYYVGRGEAYRIYVR
ncbi:ferrous iron transport protein A [Candidatus Aciduliprofundum boonei]|uniref:FeoA family protein n=1 Tax=Aciduliprofundum boonei (strain DSM 19572 / T469) TaxID=439481 RepID=B5IAB5_ACIB4|nr:FeoA domain-containing protein [Candidatus Aciduliprofundum boonei]ADD08244.1 FeoA family protein [Aciduliprofundum boonei T469]EDY36680.1 FeoA domain family [Aciduliprofundum boonei T469]